MSIRVNDIRKDFPIFTRLVKGKPLVYLDSAATSQKPLSVIEAVRTFYSTYNANVHRGVYTIGEEATAAYEAARNKVRDFIGAESRDGIVFTRNATEAINLVASSWGRAHLTPGDEILLTQMEHHSNLVPWQLVSQQTGAKLKFIPLTADGRLNLTDFPRLLTEKTKIVSVVHVSNSLGTINPVAEIVSAAHARGAIALVDASQSVQHLGVNVATLGCDFLVFSGHKTLGPTGIGVLWGKPEILDRMPPYQGGGEMINEVQLEWSTYREPPGKFEAGTPNVAGAIGLGAAIDYLNAVGLDTIRSYEQELMEYALQQLDSTGDIEIYGPRPDRGGVVSFNVRDVHPHDVATILDEEGIAVRAGHHCTQPVMRWLNVPATVRASVYLYNTMGDIDRLVQGLKKVKEIFTVATV
jgi:cysteine desulfurase/selenocysteine lyase